MSNYLQLPQSILSLPLIDKEWYWYDLHRIVQTSYYQQELLKHIPSDILNAYNFTKVTNISGAYARFDRSNYPVKILSNQVLDIVPDFSIRRQLDFTDITDARAIELLKKSQNYSSVLLFYSGGIDSTMILCAMLKNWSAIDLARVTIVMNQHCIDENRTMFDNYIDGKFTITSTDAYFTECKVDNDTLYITGALGDSLMAEENNTMAYDQLYPNTYNRSWKDNIDNLIMYFSIRSDPTTARYVVDTVMHSLSKSKFEVRTVYEFFWWISFNWGWDAEIFYSVWYWRLAPDTNTKPFLEENNFVWFNTIDHQDWAINTVGTILMMGDSIKMAKYSMKKYIYDFNHDRDYFLNKIKEGSVSKNKSLMTTALCGIDGNYNIYYRKLNTIRK